ncbi:hypothetical protein AAEY27_10310 [Kosakonia sp. BYX6]|uniref:Type II secretion system protein GspC N-terminal domain-containing protein n=1 Tax=Kosakonia calanthes TaxID=3139408 RepID=A0ABZ3BC42_9ENTR
MAIRASFSAVSPARIAHILGVALVASGLLFWGLRGWHIPPRSAASLAVQPAIENPTANAVAKWLGPGDIRLNVVVQGVMIRRHRAVALLSINDANPEPFIAGERVMENVTVHAINAEGVVLDRKGKLFLITSPISPQLPKNGIVRREQSR